MKNLLILLFAIITPLAGGPAFSQDKAAQPAPTNQPAPAPDNNAVAASVLKRLTRFQKSVGEQTSTTRKNLRVIYFYPADRKPCDDYQARWTGILEDFEKFFCDEMQRNGFGRRTINLQREGNDCKLYLVCGKQNDGHYHYGSGAEIRTEVAAAMKKHDIDIDAETLLIVCALSETNGDDTRLYSPFYGMAAGHNHGTCFCVDNPWLSAKNLPNRKRKVNVLEHRRSITKSLGDFNTTYLGGAIHELGHSLSLPHIKESRAMAATNGAALMGGGNYTYRNDLRGEGRGAHLTLPHAIRLLGHPLFNKRPFAQRQAPQATFQNLDFAHKNDTIHITGTVGPRDQPDDTVPPIAVVVYNDPLPAAVNQDYDARGFVTNVRDDRSFDIAVKELRTGKFQMRIVVVFANGATHQEAFDYIVGADAVPLLTTINFQVKNADLLRRPPGELRRPENIAEIKRRLADEEMADIRRRWGHLLTLLQAQPFDGPAPNEVEESVKTADLSDLQWQSANTGYGPPGRDQSHALGPAPSMWLLEVNGRFYEKGLFGHAPSSLAYDLGGKWKQLTLRYGFRDGGQNRASFIIIGDGEVLHDSGILDASVIGQKNDDPQSTGSATIDVTGVRQLELVTRPAQADNSRNWTVWLSPTLTR